MIGWKMLGNAWKSKRQNGSQDDPQAELRVECSSGSDLSGSNEDLVVASSKSMARILFDHGSQTDLQADIQVESGSDRSQSFRGRASSSSGSDQSFETNDPLNMLDAASAGEEGQTLHAQGVDMTSDTFDQFLLRDDELLFAVEDMFDRCCPVDALVSTGALRKMVFATQSRYNSLPNHSFRRAFDVVQATYFLIKCTGFERTASKVELFALLVVALLHDGGQVGLNNIEWYHFCRKLLFSKEGLLPRGRCNDELRNCVDEMVRICRLSKEPESMNTDLQTLDQVMDASSGSFAEPTFRRQVCRLLIRCADVFHPLRPFYLHRKWALSGANEISSQGKLQALTSDRTNVDSLGSSTIRFINFRVLPNYCRLWALFPNSVQCKNFPSHLKQTCAMWTSYDHNIQSRTPKSMYPVSLVSLDIRVG